MEVLIQMMRDGGKRLKDETEAAGADVTAAEPAETKELPSWYELSDAERVDFRRGATMAAEGKDCG